MKRIIVFTSLLLMLAPLLAAQSQIPKHSEEPTFARTQLFQIVILTGTTDGPDELKGLPKNAEKAIQDLRGFLPYKRFVLVDSALLRIGSDAGPSRTGLQGKVDTESIEFAARMSYRERDGKLRVDHFDLARMEKEGPGSRARSLLETSFVLTRGETVVVGTSKLNGAGKALIVLVTAVPAG